MNPNELHSIGALNQANASEHLSEREKHLVGLAVTLTRGCVYCTGGRIEKALASGIPQETLNATVDLTAAVNAGVVVRTALQGIEGNGQEEPCDDGTCSAGS
jgi:AhpD family alkylhydroperoxidase